MALSRDHLELPAALQSQFHELERRLWRFDTLLAGSIAGLALLGSYAVGFVSDRFWDTPAFLRLLLTLAGLGALGGCVWFYGSRWIWKRRSFEELAALVRRRHRRMGDRLLGIVELSDETKRPANISAQLCQAAIAQVATEAARVDFREAVATARPRRFAGFLALLAALLLAPILLVPQASWNALQRWALPVSGMPRYTFVALEDLPDRLVVPHGESFTLDFAVRPRAFWKPAEAVAQFTGGRAWHVPVKSGRALLEVPGQTERNFLAIHSADVTRRIEIIPEHRPALRELTAEITWPDYLGYPVSTEAISGSSFTLLEGSRAVLRGTVTRALRDAGGRHVAGATFFTDAIAAKPVELEFTWTDEFGLTPVRPARLTIKTKPDAAPIVNLHDIAAGIAILPEETLVLPIAAEDDFGLQEIGVRWTTKMRDEPGSAFTARQVAAGSQQARKLGGSFSFNPASLGIVADTLVTLEATARDYFPDRPVATSGQVKIQVLSNEAHARLVQEALEKTLADLEEITRRQEALNEATKTTSQLPPEQAAAKLGEQSEQQKANAASLENTAKELAETLQEALRNPELATDRLAEWSEQMQKMSELAQSQMPKTASALSAAQSSPAAPGKTQAAMDDEDAVLQKLREMLAKGSQNMDRLTAENLALRLRKVGDAEASLTATMQGLLPEIIGANAADLSETAGGMIKRLARSQEDRSTEAEGLQAEIARFFDRTKLTRYGDVASAMDTAQVGPSLSDLGRLVGNNVTVTAMQSATEWAGHFHEWADKLMANDSSKSPSAGNAQEPTAAQLEALMALMRLRQQEASLRERTQALPASPSEDRHKAALAAGRTQHGLQEAVVKMQQIPDYPVPPRALEPINDAMGDAEEALAHGDPGEPAIAAETDTINLLDALLESPPSGGSAASSAALAQMMKMMGLGGKGAGRTPGGSTQGGDTNQASTSPGGNPNGGQDDPHSVVKGSGVDRTKIPAEFREALDSYYEALDH